MPLAWQWLADHGLPPGGSRDIVVAVIDTGVDLNHPDLAANLWTNSREVPGNGVDDDGNGYVDDVHGVDVITNSGNPSDDHGHGTHVAGIIAAQANNGLGGVGVAYNVQIMAIKAAQYSGVLASSDIAEAIYYAVAQGADVINLYDVPTGGTHLWEEQWTGSNGVRVSDGLFNVIVAYFLAPKQTGGKAMNRKPFLVAFGELVVAYRPRPNLEPRIRWLLPHTYQVKR